MDYMGFNGIPGPEIIHLRHPFFVKGNLWQLCDLHLASEERISAERLQCLQWAGIWNITTTRLPGHGTQAHFPKKPVDWCRLGQVRHHNPSVSNVGCAIAPAMVLSSSKFAHRNSWIFMVHSYQGGCLLSLFLQEVQGLHPSGTEWGPDGP